VEQWHLAVMVRSTGGADDGVSDSDMLLVVTCREEGGGDWGASSAVFYSRSVTLAGGTRGHSNQSSVPVIQLHDPLSRGASINRLRRLPTPAIFLLYQNRR